MIEKEKQSIYNHRWYKKNASNWRTKNRNKIRQYAHKWRKENIEQSRLLSNQYYKRNAEKINKHQREYQKRIRVKVLEHYSRGNPKCICCGESIYEFLSIDHIGGGGAKWRREFKMKSGRDTYMWLIKNKFPKGFQVLCHNCNFASGHYKICPHKIL